MSHETVIRPAEFRDAEAISGLIKAYPNELLSRPIGDIVQNIDRFLVTEADGIVVGTVSWQVLPEIGAPRHPYIEIKSLAIAKGFQGKGLGRDLVTRAIQRITPMHPARVIALTFTPPFFKSLGFVEVPKEQLMHKIYTGCMSCTKYDSPFTCPEVAMALDLPQEVI
ncbi:MAG: GNAT family N-acetyltransferase [Lentisphaerae bacterium]|nr:GNAT family N-acetyltransferase [Lentisphaerota bacterium]